MRFLIERVIQEEGLYVYNKQNIVAVGSRDRLLEHNKL
jgi:hypothetical protein